MLPRSLPGGPGLRELRPQRTLVDPGDAPALAGAAGIPCWEVARSVGERRPEGLPPADATCVACFPWRLPRAWIAGAGFNVHPSLLPEWRGPAPLFWQLRAGAQTGVTVHRLEERLDAGALVAQLRVDLPDGVRTQTAESRLAAAGARLLVGALREGATGGSPQDERRATRQGWPGPADRVVSTTWPARRAYNFIRGAERWGPFAIQTAEGRLAVGEAIGYQAGAPAPHPAETAVRFSDGWLRIAPRLD